jgi:hypothetical protein
MILGVFLILAALWVVGFFLTLFIAALGGIIKALFFRGQH